MDFNAWGLQTGPFAPYAAHFISETFPSFSVSCWGEISFSLFFQRANKGEVEFTQLQDWMRQMVFDTRGIQTGPFAAYVAHFVQKRFPLFHSHIG